MGPKQKSSLTENVVKLLFFFWLFYKKFIFTVSPTRIFCAFTVPTGSLSVAYAFFTGGTIRHDLRCEMVLMTRLDLLRNTTSIGRRLKNIWMELHGVNRSPLSVRGPLWLSRPTVLFQIVSARLTLNGRIIVLEIRINPPFTIAYSS